MRNNQYLPTRREDLREVKRNQVADRERWGVARVRTARKFPIEDSLEERPEKNSNWVFKPKAGPCIIKPLNYEPCVNKWKRRKPDLIAVFLENDEILGKDVADQRANLSTVDARNQL